MDTAAVVESVLKLLPFLLGVASPTGVNLPVEGVQKREEVLENVRLEVSLKVGHRGGRWGSVVRSSSFLLS